MNHIEQLPPLFASHIKVMYLTNMFDDDVVIDRCVTLLVAALMLLTQMNLHRVSTFLQARLAGQYINNAALNAALYDLDCAALDALAESMA